MPHADPDPPVSTTSAAAVPFSALVRTPGVVPLFATNLFGRLPMGATALVLLLQVRSLTGSYSAGGVVAGANALAYGVSAPAIGRLVDRRGQTVVLLVCAVVNAIALCAIALLPEGVDVPVAALLAVVAGVSTPPLGSCLRALWPSVLRDPDRLHAMYTLESAALEMTYIAGPLLIVGGVAAHFPRAGALVCGALTLAGTIMFAARRESRAAAGRPPEGRPSRLGALASHGVRLLVVVMALIGFGFGTIEVAMPAAVEGKGDLGLTGLVLGAWGFGSMVGGLLAGRRAAPADPVRQFVLALFALAVLTAPVILASDVVALVCLAFFAGLPIAPALGLANGLVAGLARPGTATEAFTWLTTGIGGGLALGQALGGAVVELDGAWLSFALAVAGFAVAALLARAFARTLRPPAIS